jgi:large subunit ribosomal protein L9
MEIILLESLHKIGKAGEIVSVKDGFANNFLIPKKKAIVANKHNKKSLDTRIVDINKKNEERIAAAVKKQESLENIFVEIAMECNEDGKLYGSVSPKLVSDELMKMGHEVKVEMISIDDIKSIGESNLTITIYEDIISHVKIIINKK